MYNPPIDRQNPHLLTSSRTGSDLLGRQKSGSQPLLMFFFGQPPPNQPSMVFDSDLCSM